MPKIKLHDARPDQLRKHAGVVMGLEISPNNTAQQLIAKMQQADPGLTEIDVEDDAPAAIGNAPRSPAQVVSAAAGKLSTHYHDDPKVLIVIPSSKEPGGDKDVQVSVNGDTFLLQRDQETEIPYRIFLALRDAKEKDINQTIPKPGVPAKITIRDVFSYPFQVLRPAMPDEIAAWEERTGSMELGTNQALAA